MWNGQVDHPAARSRVIVPHHLPCTINPVNQGIVTVNPHNLMIVGNRECKGVPMKLILARDNPVEFNNALHSDACAVRVLPICTV